MLPHFPYPALLRAAGRMLHKTMRLVLGGVLRVLDRRSMLGNVLGLLLLEKLLGLRLLSLLGLLLLSLLGLLLLLQAGAGITHPGGMAGEGRVRADAEAGSGGTEPASQA
jgi:hypothetical protein